MPAVEKIALTGVGMDAKQLGVRLPEKREAAGYGQRDIAEFMGKKQAAVSEWENGDSNITVADLLRLADLLKTNVVDLLRDNDLPQPERRGRGRPPKGPPRHPWRKGK